MANDPSLPLRLVAVAVALAPVLPLGAIMASIGRRSMANNAIALAFAGGMIAAVLSTLGAVVVAFLPKPTDPLSTALYDAFFRAAVPEELAKFTVLTAVVLRQPFVVGRRDAVLAGGWIGLGFAIIENFLYVSQTSAWLATAGARAALSVPAHVSWGLLMGHFVAMRAREGRGLWLALAVPMALHGSYNAVLMYQAALPAGDVSAHYLPFGVFVTVLLAVWALIRGPVAASLADLDREPPNRMRVPDDLAHRFWLAGGFSTLLLIAVAPLLVAGAVAGSIWLDIRYGGLAALAIMPWTFVELWRRA